MEKSTNHKKHTEETGIRKKLIDNFNARFEQTVALLKPTNVMDMGCGEGFMLKLVQKNAPEARLTGCDISKQAVDIAQVNVGPEANIFVNDSFTTPLAAGSFDLVICTEVLEHVEQYHQMLAEIQRLAGKYVILTVPHEPWFILGNLLAGRHRSTRGNHPEHINHWNVRSFKKLVNQYFEPVKCFRVFPWIFYIGRINIENNEGGCS